MPLSVRQADSALGAASGQDLSAVAGLHSFHKAVLFAALALFGLIGTKHVVHLLKMR